MLDCAELRRFRITLRLTATEHHRLLTDAARSHLCFSAYARRLLVNAKPAKASRRPQIDVVTCASVLERLGSIATTLHQLVQMLSGREVMPSLMRDLMQSLAALRKSQRELMRVLGRKAAG